jgi:hypothetical protein
MWCVKCRARTETKNKKMATAKNGRSMMTGNCAKCGTKKTQFVSGNKSGGLYNKDNKQEFNDMEEEKPKKTRMRK